MQTANRRNLTYETPSFLGSFLFGCDISLDNEERTIPFPVELKDVCIDIFGYFDFAKRWIPS